MTYHEKFFAILTPAILLAPDLNDAEKILLAILGWFCAGNNVCLATNKELATHTGKTAESVRKTLSALVSKGYCSAVIIRNSAGQVMQREIKLGG